MLKLSRNYYTMQNNIETSGGASKQSHFEQSYPFKIKNRQDVGECAMAQKHKPVLKR